MGIYEDLGVRTIINVAGSSTRVGGALMPDEVCEPCPKPPMPL